MDNRNPEAARRIVLAREELLFVLEQLAVTTIPGLDNDPLGNLTPDGYNIARAVVERTLRARGLVRRYAAGPEPLQLHQTLITLVGVCAFAQQAIFLYHKSIQGQRAVRYFGHIRDKEIVAHTHPEAALHQFALLPSREALFTEILTLCGVPTAVPPAYEFTLPFAVFERVQEAISGGQWETARHLLADTQVTQASSNAFLALFADDYQISVLQTVKQQPDQTIAQREAVLFHNGKMTWLAFAARQPSGQTAMLVKTTHATELQQLWSAWL